MDYSTFFLLFTFVITFLYFLTISRRSSSRLPPGPRPFPIIGNLLDLTDKPHRAFTTLSKRYGPLMLLKLGTKTTIVVSSPNIAKELFQTHDQSVSNRSLPDSTRVVDLYKYSVVWLPAGDQWRKLRRISKEYLFSVQCMDSSEHLRKQKVQELLDHVNHCCTRKKAVNIGGVGFTTTLNVLANFMFSMDFTQYDSKLTQEFKDAVWTVMEVGGKPNLADFFPILKPFDPQGLVRRGNVSGKKIMTIFDKIIDQRLENRSSSSINNDVLDSLLNIHLKDESELSRNDIKHLLFAFFFAGTVTTSSILEWTMAELIRNPEKMEVARAEVMKLKPINRNIQEMDISGLPYLHAVIKETFRLHPPAPFLVPHQSIQDIEVQGFTVPKNAQILCNVWAIGRDPKLWVDPEMFMPERFLEVNIDYSGHDFELIPFGAGRRMCPGWNIAHRMLHVIVGSLIQKFDWKLEGNMRAQDMDMNEKFGLTMQQNVPLMAIPIKL